MPDKTIVDPALYSKEYFLTDNEGFDEWNKGLDSGIHDKFKKALRYGNPKRDDTVLDLGCGRGELIYYCAKRGIKILGIDYSTEGIALAREAMLRLPPGLRKLARAEVGDIGTFDFKDKYDIVFMIEVAEHMYDWQLKQAFRRIHGILKDNGRLIIMTPNYYYEKFLSPLKRTANIPLNLIKWPLRIIKGKYRNGGAWTGFKKIFRIVPDRGELNKKMHVNVTTPGILRKLLSDFDVKIECVDPSVNPINLIVKKWYGREIVAIAKKRRCGD